MRLNFLHMALVMAAAFIFVSCSDDKKNPPLVSYYQVNSENKSAIKWAATKTLTPANGEGYSIALSAGKPFRYDENTIPPILKPVPLSQMTDVFTFTIPIEDMGREIALVPGGTDDPNSLEWSIAIKLNNVLYKTGEDYTTENATITNGLLKVNRSGTQNHFTIDFRFHIKNGNVITGRSVGKLDESDNVYLNQ